MAGLGKWLVLTSLVAGASCGSDSSTQPPIAIDVSLAVTRQAPVLLRDCPDGLVQEPIYDWEDVGVGQPTLEAAVGWFRERTPDEFHGAMGTGDLLLDDALELDGHTWVPLAVDGRVVAVLQVFDYEQQGLIVWGAVACDSPI